MAKSINNIVPLILVKNDEYWLPYVLEASKRFFSKYVIYDIGSSDSTVNIIKDFVKDNLNLDFYIRLLPHIDPALQGIFRNSMIAEAQSEFYLILDADEIYSEEDYEKIVKSPERFTSSPEKLYGVVKRVEIIDNLEHAYGQDKNVSHHRIYHRTAIWNGPHPGEYAAIKQTPNNEIIMHDITCWHFHGCQRSSRDYEVPKRVERKRKGTYTPGELSDINIFEKLPILKNRIKNYAISPNLKKLQDIIK